MTIARVSQLPTEALTAALVTPVREEQQVVESLTTLASPVREAQQVVEATFLPSVKPVRAAQYVVEAIYTDPPPLRLSQVVAEAAWVPSSPVVIAQTVIEAIYRNPAAAIADYLVWPYQPNWVDRYTERMEFKTWQGQSYGGQGQRAALRWVPRVSVEFSVAVAAADAVRLDLLLAAGQSANFWLPRWHLGAPLTAAVSAGASTLMLATDNGEFAVNGYALIRSGSQSYEQVQILAVYSDHLTLAAPTVGAWPAGTRVYPLARARLKDSQQTARWSAEASLATMQFELLGLAAPAAYTPAEALDGEPVWLPGPNAGENQTVIYGRQQERIDYGFTDPHITDAPGRAFIRRSGRYTLTSRAEIAAWRGFLAAGQGRRRRFWRPVYEAGLRLTADALATDLTLSIASVGYAELFAGLLGRLALAIRTTAGVWSFRNIVAIAPAGGGNDTLTLDAMLGSALPMANVAALYFMERVTHDSDVIEISWFTQDAAETVLATVGVDQ